MNTVNQPVSPAGKSNTWGIIALVGVVACICVLAGGIVLGLGMTGQLPSLARATPTFTATLTFTPTLTPMATATRPPTDTPAPTFTPTLTPLPQQSFIEIVAALKPASEGRGVSEAAAYDKNRAGIHPIVFFSSKDQDGWNNSLPVSWRPLHVSQAELVAVIRYNNVEVEKARYIGKGTGIFFVSRMRVDTEVTLREALTGRSIVSNTFRGGEPPKLPQSLPSGTTAVYGPSVAYETVLAWLKSFVER